MNTAIETDLPSVDLPSVSPKRSSKTSSKASSKAPSKASVTALPNFKTSNSKLDLAEALCHRLADGSELSGDDYLLFDELGWSRSDIERQTRRAGSIADLQTIAGTKAELATKKTELAELTTTTTEKTEQLDAQIAATMDERDRLALAARELETDVESRCRAMDELRTKVPPHVLRIHGQLIGQVKKSHANAERLELRSRVRSLRGLPPQWSESDHDCIAAVIRSTPSSDLPGGMLDGRGRVHRDKWQSFASAKLAELPALESELTELEIKFAKKMSEIDLRLDFYLTD